MFTQNKNIRYKFFAYLIFTSVLMSNTVPSYSMDMKKAVKLTIQTNPLHQVERANVRAIANELEESSNSFKPQVDIFGDFGVQRRLSPTSSAVSGSSTPTNATREIGIRASLLLFDGFERANSVYRNAARLDGATYRLLAASETLALSAVEAYVDVVRHRKLVAATQKNISRHKQIFKLIKARVAGGKAPLSDQIQIEERVFAAEAVSIEVRNSLEDAEDKFHKVVGRKPSGKMRIPTVNKLPKTKSKFINLSVTNNYTIKQTQKAVGELKHTSEVTRAGSKPRLSLDGRVSAGEDRNGTRGDETDVYLGLSLSWRIYDGGVLQSRERAAVEREGQAQSQNDVMVRDVGELAAKSWNAFHNGRERGAILAKQTKANKRIVSSYQEEYELAKRSLLDVLDAERALFNNSFQQISIDAGYKFASYRMLATMSRLSSHFGIAAKSIAPQPNVEERIISDPTGVFNVKIEPLQ